MNKKILLLTISILLIIFLTAYFIFRPSAPNNVQTHLLTITDQQYLTSDTTRGALRVDIAVEFPTEFSNKQILSKIKPQIITQLVGEKYLTFSDDSLLKEFVSELKAEYIANNEMVVNKLEKTGFLVLNNSFSMEGFALLNDEHIFTYGILRDVDFGGNHPTRTRFFYNYNLKNGELILEDDLFKEGYEEQLTQLLREKVQQLSQEKEDMPTLLDFDNTRYNIEAIRPNGNFYINDEAICYVFNPYEIAPLNYAYETEVSLPYSSIKELLKKGNPIQYLVQQHETALTANNN